MFKNKLYFLACVAIIALIFSPVTTPAANPYQSRNQHFGVSGGNVKDISSAFCCSGTLGSLVTDGTKQYVLSNNHVLARQDQASVGEDISQPGLIDSGCRPATIVADFTKAVPLGNNVDAAIAALRAGTMDSTGFIQGIGVPSKTAVAPSVNMAVVKSGRTTGTTHGRIGSINTSVNVRYQIRCGQGKQYTLSYTHQVLINGSSFSAGGDSGSLIVTDNTSHNPVALLFAGSSTTTIANPIGGVLTKLGTQLGGGKTVHFVGKEEKTPIQQANSRILGLPDQAVDHANSVLEQNRYELMSQPGVIGVGLGVSEVDNSQAAIVVYVDNTSSAKPQLVQETDGIHVNVVLTDPFIAF
jgi:hypothetical protein